MNPSALLYDFLQIIYPDLCLIHSTTKVVGTLLQAAAPIRYIVIDPRKSDALFSCFFFSAAPTILNSPYAPTIFFHPLQLQNHRWYFRKNFLSLDKLQCYSFEETLNLLHKFWTSNILGQLYTSCSLMLSYGPFLIWDQFTLVLCKKHSLVIVFGLGLITPRFKLFWCANDVSRTHVDLITRKNL